MAIRPPKMVEMSATSSSAPARPRVWRRSESAVKPEMSSDAREPSSSSAGGPVHDATRCDTYGSKERRGGGRAIVSVRVLSGGGAVPSRPGPLDDPFEGDGGAVVRAAYLGVG